jgi:Putative MetA-pathway of phenol degradation
MLVAQPALSQTEDGSSAAAADADKSAFSLFDPTPADLMRPFSSDRPGKSQSATTVDAGHFQIESDFLTYTHDVSASQTTRSYAIGTPVLKAGLTDWADLEAAFSLYDDVRTTDRDSGRATAARGFGDLQLGSKINLFGNDGGDQALALLPFVKLPTAGRGVGNGAFEYTLSIPYSRNLPDDWSLTLEPVFGLFKNQENSGYHADAEGVVNLSHALLFEQLTGSLEFALQTSGDRNERTFYTLDPALAWLLTPDLQLDLGVFIGLDAAAPDYNPYFGISYRY